MDNSNNTISMTEHLSAILDDEAGSFEQKRVLDELKTNQDLSKKLSSYALIGETMRSGDMDKPAITVGESFLAGIHEKLEAEDQYHDVHVELAAQSISKQVISKSWLRPVGGFALAASVAAIAVVGFQNFQQFNQSSGVAGFEQITQTETTTLKPQKEQLTQSEMDAAITVPANTLVAANDELMTGSDTFKHADSRTRSLLKRYVDSHMQYASTASFVPSVRVIAYTDNQ